MDNKVVTVIGGSGFLGRYVVQKLAKRGALIKVGCRGLENAMPLLPLGNVGQIKVIPTNVRRLESVRSLIQGSDYVVNLVGILFEKGKQTFEAVHVDAARTIARACADLGVERFIHVSALAADPESKSIYAKSKAQGEEAVLHQFPRATIIRPSALFGAEDAFLNKFAHMACQSPFLPLVGGGQTKFQPVYVADVAEAIVRCLGIQPHFVEGQVFELGGRRVYTFRETLEFILETIHRRRLLVPLPYSLAYIIGFFGQMLPYPPLTVDQVRLLQSNSVVSNNTFTLENLGIEAKALEDIAPTYLMRFRK